MEMTGDVLLAAFGSAVVEVTLPVLVMVEPPASLALAWTTIWNEARCPPRTGCLECL